jgi:hypothetical protein
MHLIVQTDAGEVGFFVDDNAAGSPRSQPRGGS